MRMHLTDTDAWLPAAQHDDELNGAMVVAAVPVPCIGIMLMCASVSASEPYCLSVFQWQNPPSCIVSTPYWDDNTYVGHHQSVLFCASARQDSWLMKYCVFCCVSSKNLVNSQEACMTCTTECWCFVEQFQPAQRPPGTPGVAGTLPTLFHEPSWCMHTMRLGHFSNVQKGWTASVQQHCLLCRSLPGDVLVAQVAVFVSIDSPSPCQVRRHSVCRC
jgi:hypothetical protein